MPACVLCGCGSAYLYTSVWLFAFLQASEAFCFAWRYSFDETSYLAVNFQVGRTFSTGERHEEATTGPPGSSVPEKAENEEEEEELVEAEETWIRFLVES